MNVQTFTEILGADYYAGVPDSQLKALCDYLMDTYGIDPKHHMIGANVPPWRRAIIWPREKCLWSICKIPEKEISSTRRRLC